MRQFEDLGRCSRQLRPITASASANGAAAEPGSSTALATLGHTSAGRILVTELSDEVEKSYLAYAMSVIVGRALPDVRDGLKPVHRRILYAMHDLGLSPSKPFRKCARVVGEVLGKYHPHGDTAVYDALVRLAQPFSMRVPLIDGHGNFGSQDNDPAAAMRYTECRLQKAADTVFLTDLEYNTVDFLDTFDGAQQEPTVLPARLPNLLVNGSQGIAVGMATSIPPHNVREVVSGLRALIANPDITLEELMTHIPAPDFPTGGEIVAASGIAQAYRTGRGPVLVRGRAFIEDENSGSSAAGKRTAKRVMGSRTIIVITELPYQTNKADLVARIAKLVDSGALQGVSDVRDESDRDGMRVVVEIKRGFNAEVALNNLYKQTELQKRFSCNLVALVGNTPKTLSLKDFLVYFLDFRCQVVERRAKFELQRAERREHLVEGLLKAQAQLDRVVAVIRAAKDGPAAGAALQQQFGLSTEQTEAVLGMALRRLTSLEAGKLQQEDRELKARIKELNALLASPAAIKATVEREAVELADRLGDERRTLVRGDIDGQIQTQDIIPNNQSLVVFSRRGFIKRMKPNFFATQARGGVGKMGARLRDEDSIEEVQQVRDHQTILFFTTDGTVRSIKAYDIPEASRTASGTSLAQLLSLDKDEQVAAMLPVDKFSEGDYVVLLTRCGFLKRTPLNNFEGMSKAGKIAMKLKEGYNDELMWVKRCSLGDDVIMATSDGQLARVRLQNVTEQSRTATGTTGMRCRKPERVVGMAVVPAQAISGELVGDLIADDEDEGDTDEEDEGTQGARISEFGACLLFVTEQGLGKLVPVSRFAQHNRGGVGKRAIKLNAGDRLAGFQVVTDEEEVLLGSAGGLMTKMPLRDVKIFSRGLNTKGVILMRSKIRGDKVSTIAVLHSPDEAEV